MEKINPGNLDLSSAISSQTGDGDGEGVSGSFDALVSEARESKRVQVDESQAGTPVTSRKSRGKIKSKKRTYERRSAPAGPPENNAPLDRPAYPGQFLDDFTLDTIAGFAPFAILAQALKNHKLELTPDERARLRPAWDRVLYKYLPSLLGNYQEEFSLASAVAALLVDKLELFGPKEEKADVV